MFILVPIIFVKEGDKDTNFVVLHHKYDSYMNILITYALEVECGTLEMKGHRLQLCQTGVGKVSAALQTYSACASLKPDLVIAIGSAGTLSHKVGDILVCSKFVDRDLEQIADLGVPFFLDFSDELHSFEFAFPQNACVSSGDTFQTEVSQKGMIADVFDMEAYGSAQACKLLGIPFLAIKYVTDVIGQNSISHWEENVKHAKVGLELFLKEFEVRLLK